VISATWQDIRALRAAPTGMAAKDPARKATFLAALRQAEELAKAADAADYAARPLPLFYALSQAGRAIAAAHLPGSGQLNGHGLGLSLGGRGEEMPAAEMRKPRGQRKNGAFQDVALAIGSHPLAGPARLGALWSANPDLRDVPVPDGLGEWPPVLDCALGGRAAEYIGTSTITGRRVTVLLELRGVTGAEIADALSGYPSLAGAEALVAGPDDFGGPGDDFAGPDDLVARHRPMDEGQGRVYVGWPAPDPLPFTELWRLQDELFSVVEVNERLPLRPLPQLVGYALPEVGGGPSPAPLMLWWALLLGLSSLARYHPAVWTAAIDLDSSTLAVRLEQVLDVAAERVPVRILAALESQIP
jgi:hypothetical protein